MVNHFNNNGFSFAIKSANNEIINKKEKIQKEYKPLLFDLKFSKRLLFNDEIFMTYL